MVLLAEPRHLAWAAGFATDPFSFRAAGASALLLLGGKGQATLVADNLQDAFASRAHADHVELASWYRGKASAAARPMALAEAVATQVEARFPGNRLAVDGAVPASIVRRLAALRPQLEVVSIDDQLRQLERPRDPDELEHLAVSLDASDHALAVAHSEVRPGQSELEICQLVHQAAAQRLARPVVVYGDFVSGERCEAGGGMPSARTVRPGELVLLDFSVVVDGYRGDVCQTLICQGRANDLVRRWHELCLEVHQRVQPLLVPGTPAREIDRLARATFAAAGLAECFTSHTGHGIALGHPDPPYLVPESNDVLIEGEVVAIEPGLYQRGTAGLRLEHDYLVTARGPKQLTHHEFRLEQAGA